jgi:hypothetical protein
MRARRDQRLLEGGAGLRGDQQASATAGDAEARHRAMAPGAVRLIGDGKRSARLGRRLGLPTGSDVLSTDPAVAVVDAGQADGDGVYSSRSADRPAEPARPARRPRPRRRGPRPASTRAGPCPADRAPRTRARGWPRGSFAVPVAGLPEDARATGAARTRVGRPDVRIPELSPFDGGSRSAGVVEDIEASFAGAEDSSNELKARTRGALSYFQMTRAPGGGGPQTLRFE